MSEQKLKYLYAFIPTKEFDENTAPQLNGIEEGTTIKFIELDRITAVICPVDSIEFSEENMAKNTENMNWLQVKAFHHHQIMNELHTSYTIIPSKFGTIYKTEANLQAAIEENRDSILQLFDKLENKEEWNVKIYVKDDKFREKVMLENEKIKVKEEEIKSLPKGKQFFEKKKMAQFIEDQVNEEIEKVCKTINEKLKQYSHEEKSKKNWNKKVTGKEHDMYWNSAYLLYKEDAASFINLIQEEQNQSVEQETGLEFEITGPWPAFHFSTIEKRGVESGK